MYNLVYLYASVKHGNEYVRDDENSKHLENTVIAKGVSREALRNWIHIRYPYDTVYIIEKHDLAGAQKNE